MNIYTVTSNFLGEVTSLFPTHTVKVLPKNYLELGLSVDLLVFTGGADVYPERYGRPAPKTGWFDQERDALEFSVFTNVIRNRFRPTKVLGICRGLQVMNVAFGGTLVYDLMSDLGQSHEYIHPLMWKLPTQFNEAFSVVNSLHHQGISHIGDNLPYLVMATEPKTGLIEAIQWRDNFFAVQFHPEMMSSSHKEVFAGIIHEWILGKSLRIETPATDPSPKKASARGKVNYASDFPASFTWTSTEDF